MFSLKFSLPQGMSHSHLWWGVSVGTAQPLERIKKGKKLSLLTSTLGFLQMLRDNFHYKYWVLTFSEFLLPLWKRVQAWPRHRRVEGWECILAHAQSNFLKYKSSVLCRFRFHQTRTGSSRPFPAPTRQDITEHAPAAQSCKTFPAHPYLSLCAQNCWIPGVETFFIFLLHSQCDPFSTWITQANRNKQVHPDTEGWDVREEEEVARGESQKWCKEVRTEK